MKQQLPNMEFGRRLAVEKDLEKSEAFHNCNVCKYQTSFAILAMCERVQGPKEVRKFW